MSCMSRDVTHYVTLTTASGRNRQDVINPVSMIGHCDLTVYYYAVECYLDTEYRIDITLLKIGTENIKIII